MISPLVTFDQIDIGEANRCLLAPQHEYLEGRWVFAVPT